MYKLCGNPGIYKSSDSNDHWFSHPEHPPVGPQEVCGVVAPAP